MRDVMSQSGQPLPELEQLMGRIREVPTMFPVEGIKKGHFADACLGLSDEILEAENILRLRAADGDKDELSHEARLALFFVPKGAYMASLRPPEFQVSEASYFRGSKLELTGLFDVAPTEISNRYDSVEDLRDREANKRGKTYPISPLISPNDPYGYSFIRPKGGAAVARFEEFREDLPEKGMTWYKVAQHAGQLAADNTIWVGSDGSFTTLRKLYVMEPEGGFDYSVGTYAEPSPLPEKSWALQMLQALAPAETRRYHPYTLNQQPENSPLVSPKKAKYEIVGYGQTWAESSPSLTESDERARSLLRRTFDFLLGFFTEKGGLDGK